MNPRPTNNKPEQGVEAARCPRGCLAVRCACPAIETLDQFSEWLDTELQGIIDRYPHWETNGSNRKYFGR